MKAIIFDTIYLAGHHVIALVNNDYSSFDYYEEDPSCFNSYIESVVKDVKEQYPTLHSIVWDVIDEEGQFVENSFDGLLGHNYEVNIVAMLPNIS